MKNSQNNLSQKRLPLKTNSFQKSHPKKFLKRKSIKISLRKSFSKILFLKIILKIILKKSSLKKTPQKSSS
jgi:hypothetical protein